MFPVLIRESRNIIKAFKHGGILLKFFFRYSKGTVLGITPLNPFTGNRGNLSFIDADFFNGLWDKYVGNTG